MARFDRWCAELEAALAEPFPRDVVEQKKTGGSSIAYVPWHAYVFRLNSLVGPQGWQQDDPIVHCVGGKLVMGVPVTILGVRKVNFGSEQEDHGNPDEVPDGKGGTKNVVRDFGSAETNAFAQAFKRTLALFGMGLGMYDSTGTARAMADREEFRDRDQLIAYIRRVGPRVAPSVEAVIGGDTVNLQASIREHWARIRDEPVLARAYVREVERATGISLAEFIAQARQRRPAADATR